MAPCYTFGMDNNSPTPSGIKGWLLIYVILLGYLTLHSLALTIASLIFYAHPALAGLSSFIPLGALIFYVATNGFEIAYAIVLFILMFRKKKAAIVNNIVFNILSVVFLVAWHLLREKSNIGTFVDALPGVIGFCYFTFSRRVKATFVKG
jgi:Protein of unknown function (DUF2569)